MARGAVRLLIAGILVTGAASLLAADQAPPPATQPVTAPPQPIRIEPPVRRGVESQPAVATQPATTGPAGRIEVTPREFNFGEVWQGAAVKREFTVRNVGPGLLTLDVEAECGCTPVTKPRTPLAPGESSQFTVSYNTTRPGDVHKKVKIKSNDPALPVDAIAVSGKVNPIFDTTPAAGMLQFDELEVNEEAARTLTLRNKYPRPVKLRLKEGQKYGVFDIQLQELESAAHYELTARTKPPMDPGPTSIVVTLETDVPELAPLNISVVANPQPRVMISPFTLIVTPDARQPNQPIVRVQYDVARPISIVEVKPSLDSIKVEMLPPVPNAAGAKKAQLQFRLTLPPAAEIPDTGALVTVTTTDDDPRYQKLELPIKKQPARRPAAPTTRPAAAPRVPPSTAPAPTPPPT